MALDLKIFESVNGGQLSGSTWPKPDAVAGEYSLVQLITKCLLTDPGQDIFDTEYGAGLRRNIRGIPGQDVDRGKTAVNSALQKCKLDLLKSTATDPTERLLDLRLLSMVFDPIQTTWLVEVEVETEASVFPLPLTV